MMEERLKDILTQAYNSYPEDKVETNEIEFSLIGYRADARTKELIYDKDWNLGISKFSSILKSFIDGEKPEPQYMLTIGVSQGEDRSRVRIDGLDDIRVLCMTNQVPDIACYETKTKISHDCHEYGVRINYATETPITDKAQKLKIANIISNTEGRQLKHYRLAQRYTIEIDENLRVDFTVIRQNTGHDFRGAQLNGVASKVVEKYEIEVELTKISKEDLAEGSTLYKSLYACLKKILVNFHGGITIGQHSKKLEAMKSYVALCNDKWNLGQVSLPDLSPHTMKALSAFFVAPNISTMERDQHVKSGIMLSEEKHKHYWFTDKADGQHAILFVDGSGYCFIIVKSPISDKAAKTYDVPPAIYQTDLQLEGYRNCILDGEYMTSKEVKYYMIFDILTAEIESKSKSKTKSESGEWQAAVDYTGSKYFSERQKVFDKIGGQSAKFTVVAKQFHKYDPLEFKRFMASLELTNDQYGDIERIKTTDAIKYELDGLVFQPNDDVYPKPTGKHSTWKRTLKWKPKRFLTVDLRVSTPKKGPTKTTAVDMGLIHHAEGIVPDSYAIFQVEYMDHSRYVLSEYLMYAKIIRDAPRSEVDEPIRCGDIVECRFSTRGTKMHWEPVRVRYDKQTPNGRAAYYSNMSLIFDPVTIDNLSEPGGGLGSNTSVSEVNRYLSNRNVTMILNHIASDIKALDLGCGRAKSGNAWKNLKLARTGYSLNVLGVDKDGKDDFTSAKVFMSKLMDKDGNAVFSETEYGFNRGDFTTPLHQIEHNSNEIVASLAATEQFDGIACVFAIHYAMANEATFRTFLANVTRNLKTGGIFVGSYMMGKKVTELFVKSPHGVTVIGTKASGNEKTDKGKTRNIWSITYDKSKHAETALFGKSILVSIEGLYQDNIEYLIDLSDAKIISIMGEYGLVPVNDSHKAFNKNELNDHKRSLHDKMSPPQTAWFNLHYNFAFRKVHGFVDYSVIFNDVTKGIKTDTIANGSKLPKIKHSEPIEASRAPAPAPESKPMPQTKPKPASTATPKPASTATPKPASTATPKPAGTPKLVAKPKPKPTPTPTETPKPAPTPTETPVSKARLNLKLKSTPTPTPTPNS